MPFSPDKAAFALIAVGIAVLGVPMAADSIVRLYAGVQQDRPPVNDPRALVGIAADARQMELLDDRFDDARARIEAGLLQLRVAIGTAPGPLDPESLTRAVDNLDRGLARAPADARAWTALAYALTSFGDRAKAAKSLGMALYLSQYDPTLTVPWCELGLELWPDLSPDDQRKVARQIQVAWSGHRKEVIAMARASNFTPLISASLAENPAERADFDQAVVSATQ